MTTTNIFVTITPILKSGEIMNIEEIYKLIEELEKTNKEYKNIVDKRKEKRQKKELLIKRLKRTRRTLILSTLLYLLTSSYYKQTINNRKNNLYTENTLKIENQEKEIIKKKIEDYYQIELLSNDYYLLNSILENNNLTEEEKKITGDLLINIIEDNIYIKKESTYNSLRNLDIYHRKRLFFEKENIIGRYIYKILPYYINKIIIYKEDKGETLIHELIHAILMNEKNMYFPKFITEGMTELLTNEYYKKSPCIELNCYQYEIIAIKLLCEITSPNTVYQSFTTGNINILYDAIKKVNPKIDSKKLIDDIDELLYLKTCNQDITTKTNKLIEEIKQLFLTSNSISNNSKKTINYYLDILQTIKDKEWYTNYKKTINLESPKLYFNK